MLKLWQIVPYVILIILLYQIFEIRSTSDFMLLFVIFLWKFQTSYTYKYYKKSEITRKLTKNHRWGYIY